MLCAFTLTFFLAQPMKTSLKTLTAALALCLAAPTTFAQDSPWSGMKGKIKEGQWETKVQMEAPPGMPPGMAMPAYTSSQCITKESIDKGGFAQKDGKMPEGCTIKDMKYGGNSASWRMECVKDPKMTADVAMTFGADSYTMNQKIQMDRGNFNNSLTGRYLGPCTK